MMSKYSITDILKAVEYFKKEGNADVSIEIDPRNRLVMTAGDSSGNIVYITIYMSESSTMPTVTKTVRL